MTIHHWFIPSKKNKFHPLALRATGLLLFLALFIAIPFLYNITSAKQFRVLGYATNVTTGDLFNISNLERANAGLSPLNSSPLLNNAALSKAQDMMAKDYWAHIAPDGTTPWSFIQAAGYQYSVAGENLAKDFSLSSGVVAGWMASDLHRANILNSSYRDVGYAVLNGTLLGSETTLVVAMYASQTDPAIATTASVQPDDTEQVASAPNQIATFQPVVATEPDTSATEIEIITEPIAEPSEPVVNQTENQVPKAINSGTVAGVSWSLPIQAYFSLNWGQKVSILLASTLILLFILKHTLIWREQKRGFRNIWLRSHPLGQLTILSTVIIITVVSSVGVVL